MVHPTNILFSLSVDRILVWIITYPFANRFIFLSITNPFKFGCIFMAKYNTTLMHLGKICNANHNIDVNRYQLQMYSKLFVFYPKLHKIDFLHTMGTLWYHLRLIL